MPGVSLSIIGVVAGPALVVLTMTVRRLPCIRKLCKSTGLILRRPGGDTAWLGPQRSWAERLSKRGAGVLLLSGPRVGPRVSWAHSYW